MKLYTGHGPNPRVVDLFLALKGVEPERIWIDIVAGENRQADFLSKNPLGQVPALELDNGQVINQITAICDYLEELYPRPPLIGSSASERAQTRAWTRWIDLSFIEPMVMAFRSSDGLDFFRSRLHCIPQAVGDLQAIATENLDWLDKQLEGKSFLCGERFTLADILLFSFVDFANHHNQPVNPNNHRLMHWFTATGNRLGVV